MRVHACVRGRVFVCEFVRAYLRVSVREFLCACVLAWACMFVGEFVRAFVRAYTCACAFALVLT